MAAQITRERTGEYLKTSLLILKDKGGQLSSNELILELESRLKLSKYEKSLNKTGSQRWRTHFRFMSIAFVKAGWIEKKRRVWTLTEKAQGFEIMEPLELMTFLDKEYDKWKLEASNNSAVDDVLPESEEPEVLMQIKPGDIDFQDLISSVEKCRIQVPPFQRHFVWKPANIRLLLDSIYRGYPIGSFIFWKTARKLPKPRNIGDIEFKNEDLREGSEIAYVLDGQQRITSLFAAVKGASIDEEHYRFLFDLRAKKFVVDHVKDVTDAAELQQKDVKDLRISVKHLFVETMAEYRHLTKEYPDNFQDILANLQSRFTTYRFSVINVMDNPSADEDTKEEGVKQVVHMFTLINETGKKLTVVAKMVARCWGEGFDLRERLNEFYEKSPELENIREETILQAASVILNYRQSRTKNILEETDIYKLEEQWDSIEKAFLASIHFVKTTYNIRDLKYLPFDALLVPLTYLFYKKRQLTNEQLVKVGHWFWGACLSNRYGSTLEAKMEEDCANFDLLLEGKNPTFSFLIDWDSLKEQIVGQPYNLRNAFAKTVLSLYSHAKPLNIIDGSEVRLEKVFSGYYKHQLHHIFPVNYIRNHQPENTDKINSIANIMLIPALTNAHISDMAPSAYISLFKKGFENSGKSIGLDEILSKHHYIAGTKDSGLETDDYQLFLNQRADRMVSAFRQLTGISGRIEGMFDNEPSQAVDLVEVRIRTTLDQLLNEAVEGSYWNSSVPSDIRSAVDMKITNHLKKHPYYSINEYQQESVRLRFMDIMDYCKIILINWEIFSQYFKNKTETERHFLAYKNYRNALKHMRAVDEVEKKNGEAGLLWIERVLNTIQ